MEQGFWHEKWEKNELGFHQSEVNELLANCWPELSVDHGSWVFVPLCGKSLDMVWLVRQGYRVIGNELSELAARQFFEERELTPVINRVKDKAGFKWTVYQTGDSRLLIVVGDYFRLSQSFLELLTGEPVKVSYDRAALVAMPESMRKQYVDHLKTIAPVASIFLISLEFDHQGDKPPFPIYPENLTQLIANQYVSRELGRLDSDVKGKPAIEVGYELNPI